MTPTHSPLVELEARVQARAEHEELDLDEEAARGRLAELVEDELDGWEQDARSGRREQPPSGRRELADRAVRNLTGYGPLGPLLADDDVWEVMVNAPDEIFVRRHQGPSGWHPDLFHDDDHVTRTLVRVLDDAPTAHRHLDPTVGIQDAQLASGARLHIVHRDLARGGHTLVNIRRFTGVSFAELRELATTAMLDGPTTTLLGHAARAGATILVAGPPGSGKTTLLSCLLGEVPADRRVVVAEEVFETDVPLANVAAMQTRGARPDCEAVSLRALVSAFLRMAPDVAVVGEVRDREALPFLMALSTGVTGFATIHSSGPRRALSRLRLLCQLDPVASRLDEGPLTQLVADSIDLVVQCRRTGSGPEVPQVLAVEEPVRDAGGAHFTGTELLPGGQTPLRLLTRFPELHAVLPAGPPGAIQGSGSADS
jgi:pilus assembly protein CpaF